MVRLLSALHEEWVDGHPLLRVQPGHVKCDDLRGVIDNFVALCGSFNFLPGILGRLILKTKVML